MVLLMSSEPTKEVNSMRLRYFSWIRFVVYMKEIRIETRLTHKEKFHIFLLESCEWGVMKELEFGNLRAKMKMT